MVSYDTYIYKQQGVVKTDAAIAQELEAGAKD